MVRRMLMDNGDRSLQGRVYVATLLLAAAGLYGCANDSECEGCDPDNLVLRSISGVNYAGKTIVIDDLKCEGPRCPASSGNGRTCTLADASNDGATDIDTSPEACRPSPLVTADGLDFAFNNPLERTSIQLQRTRPDDLEETEVYDWKTKAIHIQGPITRWNGDYGVDLEGRGTMTRMVNLSCIENLADRGSTYGHGDYANPALNPCNHLDAAGTPLKMRLEGVLLAPTGLRTATAESCSLEGEGDDCCTHCQWLTSTRVARYGVDEVGTPRSPNRAADGFEAAAIQCSPSDGTVVVDKYAECGGFISSVDRQHEELRWTYSWSSAVGGPNTQLEPQVHLLPLADKLRETHPDLRPPGLESLISKCSDTQECSSRHGLVGSECMGTHQATGATCLADAYPDGECQNAVCRPEWVVSCVTSPETTGSDVAYCADSRFGATGGGACFVTTLDGGFPVGCDAEGLSCEGTASAGAPLSGCDWDGNGELTSIECCHPALDGANAPGVPGSELLCDPYDQSNITPLPVYTRNVELPDVVRGCLCPLAGTVGELDPLGECTEAQEDGCFDSNGALLDDRAGQHAVKFVRRPGGIVYDDDAKSVRWRPADTGGVPRAALESCAEEAENLGGLNRHDGWRAHDGELAENFEDFDRAMCSGQTYRVVFNEPGTPHNPAVLTDVHGNTLAGKSVYEFETSQFHVRPGSGFRDDSQGVPLPQRVGLGFSNKYDLSPENLAKLRLVRVRCSDDEESETCEAVAPASSCDSGACCDAAAPVAGGTGCEATPEALALAREANPCAAPCLTVAVENQSVGDVALSVDTDAFGPTLEPGESYRIEVPTAPSLEAAQADNDLYQATFWDVCGMPLVSESAEPYAYVFTASGS